MIPSSLFHRLTVSLSHASNEWSLPYDEERITGEHLTVGALLGRRLMEFYAVPAEKRMERRNFFPKFFRNDPSAFRMRGDNLRSPSRRIKILGIFAAVNEGGL
ncbi:MAG: hypothetical protein Greene041662_1031 [Candidatus Peregrinibacteria bacterium Greene0416_62]|nr:MAG: hypothetical protein Greene041662_1031 [Candidatus Peregrinibacteria bacterium Greene0416_62]